jgi:phage regulator Rha-like protein
MSTLIIIKDGQLVTTSLAIAEGTKNTHGSVIKLVRKFKAKLQSLGEVRFEIRLNQQGSSTEYAILNEPQSSFLISLMRNGDVVVDFKLALSKGFFEMRAQLATPAADPFAHIPPEHRALVALMCENAAIKAKQEELAHAQAAQQDSIKRIEAKQSAIENGAAYFTVIGYGTWRGITFSLTDAAALGRRASTLSKAAGIAVDAVRDPRFGKVNSYHESMLEAALSGLHGGM